MPPHTCPNSLQRKLVGGPSGDASVALDAVSNSATPERGVQSSSLVNMMIARRASSRRKPAFSAGGIPTPSAPRARVIAANGCSKPQPDSPSGAMQPNTSSMLPV